MHVCCGLPLLIVAWLWFGRAVFTWIRATRNQASPDDVADAHAHLLWRTLVVAVGTTVFASAEQAIIERQVLLARSPDRALVVELTETVFPGIPGEHAWHLEVRRGPAIERVPAVSTLLTGPPMSRLWWQSKPTRARRFYLGTLDGFDGCAYRGPKFITWTKTGFAVKSEEGLVARFRW